MYNQYEKRIIRHSIIRTAVETLTLYRERAACVSRDYVRNIYDHFTENKDYSRSKEETQRIDKAYITNWESLHDAYMGKKEVRDLVVCYLCGPEPNNDFQELIDLGVLPQNIWAFESNKDAYVQAVGTYKSGEFPQPRILRQNIDTFFKVTPKKFDIVYIDACGSVPSSQHALKTISTMCLNSRLNSPGVIITNFSSPDINSEGEEIEELVSLISLYKYFKEPCCGCRLVTPDGKLNSKRFEEIESGVRSDFKQCYGDFISALLRDIPSVIIPIQRISDNTYLSQFVEKTHGYSLSELIEMASGNPIASFFFYVALLKEQGDVSQKTNNLLGEIGDFKKIVSGFEWLLNLRNGKEAVKNDIKEIRTYFEEPNSIYRFLDKPHSNLVFDAVINQLIYPMHFNPDVNKRYFYKAKVREMYTDVTVFDECRYIYEWLPALHQIKSAFDNLSWQYVFRFSIDGLIRTRMNYNNEFFYQGAVVSHETGKFEKSIVKDRIECMEI